MLYLIGFMGVGKTTIGKKIAKHYNVNFFDTDKGIEELANNNTLNIFHENGEAYYRILESKILKIIPKKSIVACGGGLPAFNKNMDFIKATGSSIYLKASKESIFNRLSGNLKTRPLVKGKTPQELKNFIKTNLKKREIYYRLADYTINTSGLSEQEVLAKINRLILSIQNNSNILL
tara:strand:- start:688 stop:1218 length:531 start_codon:yes stop_codon:yes gene_type:complete